MKNTTIFFALLFVLGIGFVALPMKKELANITLQKNVLTTQKKKISEEFKKIQENIQSSSSDNSFNEIPTRYDQALFLEDIQSILKKNGLEVKTFQFSLGSNPKIKAEQLLASFQIKGSRGDIYNFLKAVEENKNFMGVKSFSIGSGESAKETTFGVSLYSFFQKE